MSIDTCYKCGAFVDTDNDCDCYVESTYKGQEIIRCICEKCRESLTIGDENE